MTALRTGSHADARARREQYYELRRAGMCITDAAAAVDVYGSLAGRYERWFKATERGEQIVPGKLGRRRATP